MKKGIDLRPQRQALQLQAGDEAEDGEEEAVEARRLH